MAKSDSEYKRTERKKKRLMGWVPKEVWIRPEHSGRLKEVEKELQQEFDCGEGNE